MGEQRKRAPLLALGILSLLAGLWGGLRRLGWDLPELRPDLLMVHGPLMVCGFLGTLICLERAVAFGKSWGLLAPLAAGAGGVLSIAGVSSAAAAWLELVASVLLLAMFTDFVRKQRAASMIVMAVAAALWVGGNALWILDRPMNVVSYWWAGFIVLTILGERYGFSRMMTPSAGARRLFWSANTFALAGLAVATIVPGTGAALLGAGFVMGNVWVILYDIARKSIGQTGLPRYVAWSVLSGSVWLGVGGWFLLFHRDIPAGPYYDAILHSVFVGFAFSMIFGHAPLIFPSVLKIPLHYRPFYYAPLVLLHASVALRLVADLLEWSQGRQWGGMANAAAVLSFFAANVAGFDRSKISRPR